MDEIKVYDLAASYAEALIQSEPYQRYLFLKEEIKRTLSAKIIGFKTLEAKYLEAKSYGKYHPDLERYQKDFTAAKKALFEEPLLKEYKALEQSIQRQLNTDMDEIKVLVSNKFNLSSIF